MGVGVVVGTGVSVGKGVSVGGTGAGPEAHPLNKSVKNTNANNADRTKLFITISLILSCLRQTLR
jgi:hypothetical protein